MKKLVLLLVSLFFIACGDDIETPASINVLNKEEIETQLITNLDTLIIEFVINKGTQSVDFVEFASGRTGQTFVEGNASLNGEVFRSNRMAIGDLPSHSEEQPLILKIYKNFVSPIDISLKKDGEEVAKESIELGFSLLDITIVANETRYHGKSKVYFNLLIGRNYDVPITSFKMFENGQAFSKDLYLYPDLERVTIEEMPELLNENKGRNIAFEANPNTGEHPITIEIEDEAGFKARDELSYFTDYIVIKGKAIGFDDPFEQYGFNFDNLDSTDVDAYHYVDLGFDIITRDSFFWRRKFVEGNSANILKLNDSIDLTTINDPGELFLIFAEGTSINPNGELVTEEPQYYAAFYDNDYCVFNVFRREANGIEALFIQLARERDVY